MDKGAEDKTSAGGLRGLTVQAKQAEDDYACSPGGGMDGQKAVHPCRPYLNPHAPINFFMQTLRRGPMLANSAPPINIHLTYRTLRT